MKTCKSALFLIILLSPLSLLASGASKEDGSTLEERIAPVAHTCMAGESCAAAPVASAGGTARSGEDIYKTKCVSCHGTGAAGAPKFSDAGAWAPRISKGVETLYNNAIKGYNGMPAKGLCFDCSDEEIQATVDYIVENSQ